MLVLKSLCVQHNCFYHKDYKQAYNIFKSSFFLVKLVNRCENYEAFWDIQHLLQVYILYHYFHPSFL